MKQIFNCPKCNSTNLHTAYLDDAEESISCENCDYVGDIKEFTNTKRDT